MRYFWVSTNRTQWQGWRNVTQGIWFLVTGTGDTTLCRREREWEPSDPFRFIRRHPRDMWMVTFTRPKNINIRLKAKQFNLLTSTSFFFLVMLFFWSFSGWGAALLTGGLEQRVARSSTVLNKKQQQCLPGTVSWGQCQAPISLLPHSEDPPSGFLLSYPSPLCPGKKSSFWH